MTFLNYVGKVDAILSTSNAGNVSSVHTEGQTMTGSIFAEDNEGVTSSAEKQVHTVQKGDTLNKIAKENGVTVSEILKANPQIMDADSIEIGEQIKIPKKQNTESQKKVETKPYSIKSGDTLNKIAKENGITVKELLKLNPQIIDPDEIEVNQKINLPKKETPVEQPKAQVAPEKKEPETTTYSVQSGDTLGKIASRNGISLKQLLELNPQIENPNNISVNQKINIPKPNYEQLSLSEDDCVGGVVDFAAICKKYNITMNQLANANKHLGKTRQEIFDNLYTIEAGKTINIPKSTNTTHVEDDSTTKSNADNGFNGNKKIQKAFKGVNYDAEKGQSMVDTSMAMYGDVKSSTYWCARGVSNVTHSEGITEEFRNGNAKDLPRIYDKSDSLKKINVELEDVKDLPAGCIVLTAYPKATSGWRQYGHVWITDGKGNELTDYVSPAKDRNGEKSSIKLSVYVPVKSKNENINT